MSTGGRVQGAAVVVFSCVQVQPSLSRPGQWATLATAATAWVDGHHLLLLGLGSRRQVDRGVTRGDLDSWGDGDARAAGSGCRWAGRSCRVVTWLLPVNCGLLPGGGRRQLHGGVWGQVSIPHPSQPLNNCCGCCLLSAGVGVFWERLTRIF